MRGFMTKINSGAIILSVLVMIVFCGTAFAGGPFGSPQPLSKESGGLRTAIGYWHYEDKFDDGTDHVIRQNQVYSEAAYGKGKAWEAYGRIGLSDLKISNAFRSTQPSTTTSKRDFEDNWNVFGTLGVKGFYPLNEIFGIGAFVQGTYFFRDADDNVYETAGGTSSHMKLRVTDLWDVNFGMGLQATVWRDTKLYAGPYIYYAEARVSPSPDTPGIQLGRRDETLQNKTNVGGFAGIDVPIAKGFRLNMEGQYSERFSAGAAITLVY
jgi:hypothetical protein